MFELWNTKISSKSKTSEIKRKNYAVVDIIYNMLADMSGIY